MCGWCVSLHYSILYWVIESSIKISSKVEGNAFGKCQEQQNTSIKHKYEMCYYSFDIWILSHTHDKNKLNDAVILLSTKLLLALFFLIKKIETVWYTYTVLSRSFIKFWLYITMNWVFLLFKEIQRQIVHICTISAHYAYFISCRSYERLNILSTLTAASKVTEHKNWILNVLWFKWQQNICILFQIYSSKRLLNTFIHMTDKSCVIFSSYINEID